MAKATIEVLVDDLDGSEAVESVRLGWNGQWRELELSEKNLAALSKVFDRFWEAGRPVRGQRPSRRGARRTGSTASRVSSTERDPKAIREWAHAHGIPIPSRGRIPGDVEQRYNQAGGT